MKILSNKEAKVETFKYEYVNSNEYLSHSENMKNKGYRKVKSKQIDNNKWIATYIKYSSLNY